MRPSTPTELTRPQLFQRLWREPLSSVAADLGLSASGLAKLCDRTAIPYPTRGHWAKARAGRAASPPDLPPAPTGVGEQILITPGQPIARRTPVRLSSEDRRQQLLEVAARIIVQDGLHALTIKRVARDAGLTAPRAYHFFPTVDDLMAALARRELEAIRAARTHRINTAERPAERLRLSTVTYLRQVAERGVLLQTLQNAPGVRRALRGEQRAIRADNTHVVASRFSDSHHVPSDVSRAATTALTSAVLRTGRILARGRLDLPLAEILAADIVEAGNRRLAARFQAPSAGDVEDA
ncbi:TetR/AcrR family transcriptional regulator [Phenylobacterium sp.]|uniref:TetR/AcrR family transcriptional regulator n=1 Tax=Phenylobacterium sp. TaxID=1871053 RepID=UPI0027225B66|nr:TetR/AcrR family transcriptional regulator [Phenylobacterium sp.]MDO8377524.1 TetR/AcrR family transcriptional regulator [Phenylobacterium sp.]